MSGPGLPVNTDATYPDDPLDTSKKIHQQHHDVLHGFANKFDTSAGAAGYAHIKDSSGLYVPAPVARAAYIGTFAGLPPAADNTGSLAYVTDINGGTSYLSNGTTWIPIAPGLNSLGGVLLQSAELTAGYSIFSQAAPTTFTDIGLSVAIASVQSTAYIVELNADVIVTGGTTYASGSIVQAWLRIVDSAVTKLGGSANARARGEGTTPQNIISNLPIKFRVPAGHAATTWKVQAKISAAAPTGVTEIAVNAGAAFQTPTANYQSGPAILTATSVA